MSFGVCNEVFFFYQQTLYYCCRVVIMAVLSRSNRAAATPVIVCAVDGTKRSRISLLVLHVYAFYKPLRTAVSKINGRETEKNETSVSQNLFAEHYRMSCGRKKAIGISNTFMHNIGIITVGSKFWRISRCYLLHAATTIIFIEPAPPAQRNRSTSISVPP